MAITPLQVWIKSQVMLVNNHIGSGIIELWNAPGTNRKYNPLSPQIKPLKPIMILIPRLNWLYLFNLLFPKTVFTPLLVMFMIHFQCRGICKAAKSMIATLAQMWISLQAWRSKKIVTPYSGFLPP